MWLVSGMPKRFWLSAFFSPPAFLTAILQRHARKYQIAIDNLGLRATVLSDEPGLGNPAEACNRDDAADLPDGAAVFGCFLQGGSWGGHEQGLVEAETGQLFATLPVIWLRPVDMKEKPDLEAYPSPVYKTSLRAGVLSTTGHSTNFLCILRLPSLKPADHWIRRGCAILLATES